MARRELSWAIPEEEVTFVAGPPDIQSKFDGNYVKYYVLGLFAFGCALHIFQSLQLFPLIIAAILSAIVFGSFPPHLVFMLCQFLERASIVSALITGLKLHSPDILIGLMVETS